MNWEKLISNRIWKPLGILRIPQNFWPYDRPCWLDYICKYIYLSISKSIYNLKKKPHTLQGIILFVFLYFLGFFWPWKLTFSENWINFFFRFVFYGLLKLYFFIRCL